MKNKAVQIFFVITAVAAGSLIIPSCSFNYNFLKRQNTQTAAVQDTVEYFDDMVFISGGWFNMGSKRKADERPVHKVYVSSFYMDKTEVTVYDFRRFCQATRRTMPHQPEWSSDDHPVVNVTWSQAAAYAHWAGKRLPTESEWEYAAKSNNPGNRYTLKSNSYLVQSFGNIADESILSVKSRFPIKRQYDDGYVYSSPAGSYPSNANGLYDMEGNVLEWCNDWYDKEIYKSHDTHNPLGPIKGFYKVIRGGAWNRSGKYLRISYRSFYNPKCSFNFIGFRCVQDYNPPQNQLVRK